jgi:hypothetical protein
VPSRPELVPDSIWEAGIQGINVWIPSQARHKFKIALLTPIKALWDILEMRKFTIIQIKKTTIYKR